MGTNGRTDGGLLINRDRLPTSVLPKKLPKTFDTPYKICKKQFVLPLNITFAYVLQPCKLYSKLWPCLKKTAVSPRG